MHQNNCSFVMKKTVLITGTSSGIGKETAKLFAEKGWNVAATMRSPEKEQELSKLKNVVCLKLDVTNPATIANAIDETIRTFGQIDVVVNNAGFAVVGPFEATTDEQVRHEIETNILGVMAVTRSIIPYFRERKSGIIINVASMGGRITFPLYSVYHASKWAVEGFSESLQHELKAFNIKVKIIEPGTIKTGFYGSSMDIAKKEGLTAYDAFVNRAMPYMIRTGKAGSEPKEIAALIYHAATDISWKLRYSGGKNAKLLLTARRLLSDRIFNGLIRRTVLR
jgi:NAD(P)-dependent dehydrogenase (short-subunit alcohol dehydrogenase family)